MTVTGINIEEKVRNYEGNNDFIKGLKPGLMKYGRLTPKQFAVAEKLILQEERQNDVNVDIATREKKKGGQCQDIYCANDLHVLDANMRVN